MRLRANLTNRHIFECFASETRLRIIELLAERPMNIKELAEALGVSSAIVTKHVQKMEDAGLIDAHPTAAKRGMQKLCRLAVAEVTLLLSRGAGTETGAVAAEGNNGGDRRHVVSIPVGQYAECSVRPTCGLASRDGLIGMIDDPRYFSDPEHVKACHLWFGSGYVEYRIPHYLLRGERPKSLEISLEICSEAPGYNESWPSDISFYINGILLGTWTCPGDFGSSRGIYTPADWVGNTQFGLLKTITVTGAGTRIDGVDLSGVTIRQLGLADRETFAFRIASEETARHRGGVSLFGRGFGNYDQDIVVTLEKEVNPS